MSQEYKALNILKETYADVYSLVVPIMLKEKSENLSQDEIVCELIKVYLEVKGGKP